MNNATSIFKSQSSTQLYLNCKCTRDGTNAHYSADRKYDIVYILHHETQISYRECVGFNTIKSCFRLFISCIIHSPGYLSFSHIFVAPIENLS